MILVKHIEVEAMAGANEFEAVKAAVKLAIDEWRNVSLDFNGKFYYVDPKDICTYVLTRKKEQSL